MQQNEFDKLFSLEHVEAKWADLGRFNQSPVMVNKQLRADIRRNEKIIPKDIRAEIDALIRKLRNDGYKDAKIKRIVKTTFRITIV